MDIIKLRDNRFDDNAPLFKREPKDTPFSSKKSDELDGQSVSEKSWEVLKKFDGFTLAKLVEQGKDAVVDLSQTQHLDDKGRKKLYFFKLADDNDNQFRLETGNLMGVLRFRDKESRASVQVEILSRFDKGKNNFFLNYLLSKAFDFAISAESVSAERSSLLPILLDIVFVRRLGEAAKAGLLRHYREFRNNDSNFKGSLDLARHIRENIPLMHGIAYRKREIDLDVPVNRMILMAALTVNRRHPGFFEGNRDAADALCQLRMGVTEERDLRAVLSHRDCREPVSHPFFREVWEPLRQIARMILEDEQWTLFPETATEDEVSGIVFDGSWLWEEYLAKLMSGKGYDHCVKGKSPKGMLHAFHNVRTNRRVGPMYPDFIRMEEGHYSALADAKYKLVGLVRDDRLQMIAYAHVFESKIVQVIYPPPTSEAERKQRESESGDEDDMTEMMENKSKSRFEDCFLIRRSSCQNPNSSDKTVVVQTISFADEIPKAESCAEFKSQMAEKEKAFLKKLGIEGFQNQCAEPIGEPEEKN